MLLIHKIEQTHFSATEAIIIDYILDQGLNIKICQQIVLPKQHNIATFISKNC